MDLTVMDRVRGYWNRYLCRLGYHTRTCRGRFDHMAGGH